jgi:hypothetical protein
MTHTDIINELLQKINGKKYLEIGVFTGENLRDIKCDYKVGVDPDVKSAATIIKTSDDFFKTNEEKFFEVFGKLKDD